MPGLSLIEITPLQIDDGETDSNMLLAKQEYEDAVGLTLIGPFDMGGDTGITLTLQSGNDRDEPIAANQEWGTIESGDPVGDLGVPNEQKRRTYFELPCFPAIRIHAASAVSADRKWRVYKVLQT